MMKKMMSISEVRKKFPDGYIEQARCPECGGILVTKFGAISITVCVEEGCLYSEYDYDFD